MNGCDEWVVEDHRVVDKDICGLLGYRQSDDMNICKPNK